jgi:hypothetical protein
MIIILFLFLENISSMFSEPAFSTTLVCSDVDFSATTSPAQFPNIISINNYCVYSFMVCLYF